MKLKLYKNQYGYLRVNCPFCNEPTYYRQRKGRDPMMDLRRHFINRARQEALDYYLGKYPEIPAHLQYVKDHTKEKVQVKTISNYQFDNDLEVSEKNIPDGKD